MKGEKRLKLGIKLVKKEFPAFKITELHIDYDENLITIQMFNKRKSWRVDLDFNINNDFRIVKVYDYLDHETYGGAYLQQKIREYKGCKWMTKQEYKKYLMNELHFPEKIAESMCETFKQYLVVKGGK